MSRAHRIVLALAFGLAALLALRQVGSGDIGFHLRTGEWILDGHGWPRTDPFTETLKTHPYVDTSWGFDVLVALVHRLAGPTGLGLLVVVLVLGITALLVARARLAPGDSTLLVIVVATAVIAMEMRYEPRPELISYLFLAALLFWLARRARALDSRGKETPQVTPLWPVVLLQFVWANSHSLFVLGWGVMTAFLIGGSLERRKLDRPLALALMASIAVSFLNPYGVAGVLFPFQLLTRFQKENPFAGSIGEFVSPLSLHLSDAFPFYPKWPINSFRLLALLGAVSVIPLLRRRRFTDLLLMILVAPLALRMIRNVPLLVIATAPVVAGALPVGGLFRRPAIQRGTLAFVGVIIPLLGLRVVHDAYYVETRRTDHFGVGWNVQQLPVNAVRFAEQVHLPGALLNHLNFGGWMLHAQPGPVFIDGRLEVVGESFFNDYQRIFASEVALEQAVQRYGIGWIIYPTTSNPDLTRRLSADPRWRLAYVDGVAVIFLRIDRPDTKDDPGRFVDPAIAAMTLPAAPATPWNRLPGMGGPPRPSLLARWWDGVRHRQLFPSDDFNLGLFHFFRKEFPPAIDRFGAAIATSGGAWYDSYLNLGSSLWRTGDHEGAAAAYRVVLRDDPENRLARERLASMVGGTPGSE